MIQQQRWDGTLARFPFLPVTGQFHSQQLIAAAQQVTPPSKL